MFVPSKRFEAPIEGNMKKINNLNVHISQVAGANLIKFSAWPTYIPGDSYNAKNCVLWRRNHGAMHV